MGFCSSCACAERQQDLIRVEFPPFQRSTKPAWLQSWSEEDWTTFGEAWWKTLSSLLDIKTYLSKYLQTDRRCQDAEKELETARQSLREATQKQDGEADVSALGASVLAAEIWHQRVLDWKQEMIRDLTTDSVAAPGDEQTRWLLHLRGHEDSLGHLGLHCPLCAICAGAFSKRVPELPKRARAHGLWGGPEPEELRALTFIERQVIRLARVFALVKRISFKEF